MKRLTVVEEAVMLAIYRLNDNAYSVRIHQKIMEMTGKDMIIGTLFNALKQLNRKGYLIKTKGKPIHGKGKKSIMLYRISEEGFEALEQTRAMNNKIWDRIPGVLSRAFK
jgi:DNA-binding PadR family transcriptional regulator